MGWLWVGLGAAGVAVGLGLARRREAAWALLVAVLATAGATNQLVRGLVDDDFSLRYVADFSRRHASTSYRVAALWGGMAGSLLFFATVAGIVGVVATWAMRRQERAQHVVVVVVGGLLAALLGLVLGLANPFERLDLAPVDGNGMPPILEHPAMLYHPPLLYLGLATLTGPFALTVAGLLGWIQDDAWPRLVRRWLLVPWALLGVGMVAGAHWAYVELGWGGYWAWDPVENTALLPWLAVTLALHAGIRDPKGRTQAAFTSGAFLLALTGTMLTRSGAVPSVHAFAEDTGIGRALAALVAVAAVGVVALFVATRGPRRPPADGRVRRLLLGQLTIGGAILAIVFIGTIAPLWADLTGAEDRAIEGHYFASFVGPLAVVGLALLALVPVALKLSDNYIPAAVGAIGGAGIVTAAGGHARLPQLILAAAAGAALASAAVGAARARGRIGPQLAHAGLGLLVLGIAGTATGETQELSMHSGDEVVVLGQTVRYRGVQVEGTDAVVADVEVSGTDRKPSLVAYPELRQVLAETTLVSTPWRDVQVGLVDAADSGTAVMRVSVHPLQIWVWWGGLLIVIGGAVSAVRARRGTTAAPRSLPEASPAAPSDRHPAPV